MLFRHVLIAALAALIATTLMASPVFRQRVVLQPGHRVDARLARGATDTYAVSLAAGHYAHVVIEQPSFNLLERVTRNDGLVLDGLGGPDLQVHGRPDRIVLIADAAGDYAIDVTSIDGKADAYAIAIVEHGELNAVERQRFDAQRLFADAVAGAGSRPWTVERRAQLESSRAAFQAIGDAAGELDALLSLGLSYLLTDRPAGRPHFLAAVELARRSGDLRTEREALNDLGETATAIGEPRQAAEHFLRALEVDRQIDPSRPYDLLIYNLSVAYRSAGEFQLALRHGYDVLEQWRASGDAASEAYAAHNVGMTHFLLGDSDTALEFLTLAFERWRSVKHATGIARSYTAIGTVRAARGEHREAMDSFQEAIKAWRVMGDGTGDVAGEGGAARSLAVSLAELGRWNEAAPIYDRALALARQSGARILEADTLRGLADMRRATGGPGQAVDLLEQSLALARASEDRAGVAATLLALARIARDRDRLDESRIHIEQALELIENLRTTVSNPDLRASFAATKRDYYDFYIDLLMQLHRRNPRGGHDVAALMASERGRARGLIEMLTETGADIRSGAPSELLDRERLLRQEVTQKAARLTRLLGSSHSDAQAAGARAALQQAVTAYDDAQARVRAESPRYAELTQFAPLDLPALRGRLLDGQTALVEYALGRDRSYAWVVTSRSISVHQLPPRPVIEAAAREAYELLASSHRREVWGPANRAAARLSDLILAPVIGELPHSRILIVADGALHYVPFAALPTPGTSAPLVVTKEIVNLPSASALAVIRGEAARRASAPNRIAVLADPVLTPFDERVRGAQPAIDRPAAGRSDLLRSAAESGIPQFERLAYTRDEADAIAALAGRSRALFSVDFDASRATALGEGLADYRVVHFATHGLINSAHPQLSGLVLSLVDQRGQPQDGFVRLHDIYNMKLRADLVVLSACRTALGRDVRGEGLVGLTRGFMYAGAPRVVASLWDVRDRATAELMKRFYARMLTDGLAPAAALRAAQVSMWQEPRWQSPFDWAGFVIQGEWNPMR